MCTFLRRTSIFAFFSGWTAVAALGLSGCSHVSRVEIRSEPPGAEVRVSGEKIGVTPFILQAGELGRFTKNGRLDFVLVEPGYIQRELVMDVHGDDLFQVQLSRQDTDYFNKVIISDYSNSMNELSRDLLKIQGWVFARKMPEAEAALKDFVKKYPNVAASYVLYAGIEMSKGHADTAKSYLLRARSIDPVDPVVARMLGGSK